MNGETDGREPADGDDMIRDVVRSAFPGRGDETTEAFVSTYEGDSSPPDYRDNIYPRDNEDKPLYTGSSSEEYFKYVEWLADHLPQIELEPSPKQAALCESVAAMKPCFIWA